MSFVVPSQREGIEMERSECGVHMHKVRQSFVNPDYCHLRYYIQSHIFDEIVLKVIGYKMS